MQHHAPWTLQKYWQNPDEPHVPFFGYPLRVTPNLKKLLLSIVHCIIKGTLLPNLWLETLKHK